MRRLHRPLFVLLFLLFTVNVQAQVCEVPPSPGPGWVMQDCGWLPPGHPSIRVTTTVEDCRSLNPYTQPEALKVCLAAIPPTTTGVNFVLGQTYGLAPYMSTRTIIVIGKSLGLDGVEVITGQIVLPASQRGAPIAFRNDGSRDAARWVLIK
jgi:hypothetical protein